MVVFNCNACGEALKKNQVEKHTLRCRYCEALSCVDCGKDFWGNDYQTHTKCMTENEKYCGKNYVPKVNKGEAKQEQWIEKVQSAIDKSVSNPKLKGLLERLKDYPNIPRKKIKFVNFLKNSLRFHNEALINQVWDTLMAANTQDITDKQNGDEATKQTVNGSATDICDADNGKKENGQERADKKEKKSKNESTGIISEKGKKHKLSDKESKEDALQDKEEANVDRESNTAEHKLSKRERKEERRKKANKKEKKDKNDNSDNKEETGNDRKGKKRKHSENDEIPEETEVAEEIKKKKKQASELKDCDDDLPKNGEDGNMDNESNDKSDEEITEPKKKKSKKVRFNWEATILEVLKSKGEMSLKKLQKKVLNEFAALDAANYAEDNLRAKFDKKVKKIAQVKVFKDRVKLK